MANSWKSLYNDSFENPNQVSFENSKPDNNMAKSWKSMYNDSFENPNQVSFENSNQFTFENPNLNSFIVNLSQNQLLGTEAYILSQIIQTNSSKNKGPNCK